MHFSWMFRPCLRLLGRYILQRDAWDAIRKWFIFDIMRDGQLQIERCKAIAKEFGAKRLILFGSALYAPAKARDLDFLCEGVDGWKLYEMAAKMEEETGVSVDVVPIEPTSPFVEYNLKEGREVLAA